jgi:DMSO reductase family type II enzyme heme b subunit
MSIDTIPEPPAAPSEHEESDGTTRRNVIIGGAVGLGAAAVVSGALSGCSDDAEATTTTVISKRIKELPPWKEPDSSLWDSAEVAVIQMDGQLIAQPFRDKPFVPTIRVKSLHDGATIAFRLEWDDDSDDDLTVKVDQFRDGCAVLLSETTGSETARIMGAADQPVTILQWKADWQHDLADGFQEIPQVYPNAAVDFYPPIVPYEKPPTIPTTYEEHNALQWIPGIAVDNPISQPQKTTAVEKNGAKGFGTLMAMPTQNALGWGTHADGTWSVVLAKPMAGEDQDEVTVEAGGELGLAVSIWAGQTQDSACRKTPCKTILTLKVEA